MAGLDVDVLLDRGVGGIGHADLLAHVDVGRAAQEVDGGGEHGRGLVAVALHVPEAVDGAGLVVVVPEQGVPAAAVLEAEGPVVEEALEGGDVRGHEAPLLPVLVVDLEVVEVEDHGELVVLRAAVADAGLDGGRGHLADGDGVGVLAEAGLVEAADELVDEGAVGVGLPVVGAGGGVGEGLGLPDDVDDVEAEGAHAVGAPEVDDPRGLLAHLGVVPVEVGLGGVVEVHVVLGGGVLGRARRGVVGADDELAGGLRVDGAGAGEGRPGGAAELAHPVGGEGAVGLGGADVEVVAVALLPRERPLEPLVLGGDVVEDHVEHGTDAVLGEGGDELVEVLHGAHGGVDGAVVGDVVAVVVAR